MNVDISIKVIWACINLLFFLPLISIAEERSKHIAPESLPNSLLVSWQINKPNLGKFGQCAAAFDSKTDDSKMAFACSIYVKLTSVAERKALQHCNEQREARRIKAPCQLVK
jgi:hypothetical protein